MVMPISTEGEQKRNSLGKWDFFCKFSQDLQYLCFFFADLTNKSHIQCKC